MFLLGLTLAVCFVPGYLGSFIPAQWAVLSILLPMALWRHGDFPPIAQLGLVALSYSALSIFWAPDPLDAGFGLWLACIWALCFWLGCTMTPADFPNLFRGLAIGLWVSSAIALLQSLGLRPVLGEGNSGLFFNSTLLGACATLIIIALITQRLWLYIPGCLPALFLSGSRGAIFVLVLTLATFRFRLRWVLLALALATLAFLTFAGSSDSIRLTIWGSALRGLDFWGNGIGSFASFFLATPIEVFYPGRVHNDYIQLWFEIGPMAIALAILGAVALSERTSPHWPIFFAISIYALFYFPLWSPIPAFLAFMVAGAMLRDRHLSRLAGTHRRHFGLPRYGLEQPVHDHLGRQALPIPSAN